MKKLLAILLIFLLVMGMAACGGNEETPSGDNPATENTETDETTENEEQNGEESEGTGNGSIGTGQTVNPDELILNENEYSAMEEDYDFGMNIADDFGLSSVIEEVSYADIEALIPVMEERLGVADSIWGSSFTAMGDYEGYDEDEIDKLTYAIAMEDDDMEGIYLEAGAYHRQSDDKNYQYVLVATENCYEISDANTKSAVDSLKKAMGVEVSEKTLGKAIKTAYDQAVATEDYFSLLDVETRSGKGYKETVKVSVDAFAYEDGTIGYYVSCERERCYK